jgi:hypothetical protein
MGLQLKVLFAPFDLSNKIMSYIKDEGAILKNLTNALTSICEPNIGFLVQQMLGYGFVD